MLPHPLNYRSLADHQADRRPVWIDRLGDIAAMLLDLIGLFLASIGALVIWFVGFVLMLVLLAFLIKF